MRTILASQTVTIPDNGKSKSLLYNSIVDIVAVKQRVLQTVFIVSFKLVHSVYMYMCR